MKVPLGQCAVLCGFLIVPSINMAYVLNYIGDGDSSAYKKVSESKPYGDQPVGKLECVGHIQETCWGWSVELIKRK